jgi:ATP-binding cassette subfamily C protein
MKQKGSDADAAAALKEVRDFWRVLFVNAGAQRVLRVSGLLLAAALSEGLTIALLIPLLRAIDPISKPEGGSSRLDAVFASLDLRPSLSTALTMFVGVAFLRAFMTSYTELAMARLRLDVVRKIRVQLYSAIACANWLLLRRMRAADLHAALITEVNRLGEGAYLALNIPSRVSTFCINLLVATMIAPTLTFCAVVAGVIIASLVRSRLGESLVLGVRLSDAHRHLHRQVSEFLAGLKITKSLGSEERHIGAFNNAVEEVDFQVLAFTRSAATARFLQEIAAMLAVAVFVWASVALAQLSISEVLVLALILYRLLPLMQSVQQAAQQVLHIAPSVRRVLELTRQCEAEREVTVTAAARTRLTQTLVVRDLRYRHEPNEPEILSGLSFTLRAGSLTVLSGESGAGKSTLLDVLAGLIRQEDGEILVDGKVLGPSELLEWRRGVGYLTQEPFLFHDTIRANLLVADPQADDAAIEQALVAASAEFIERLPQHLETVVGDRGARMSGGERQRLALARALLRKPALLILDEPTSALDRQNERSVLEAIERLKGQTTTFLVTHRPERVQKPDQVLYLHGGKLSVATAQLSPSRLDSESPLGPRVAGDS